MNETSTIIISNKKYIMQSWQATWLRGFFWGQQNVIEKTIPVMDEALKVMDKTMSSSNKALKTMDKVVNLLNK